MKKLAIRCLSLLVFLVVGCKTPKNLDADFAYFKNGVDKVTIKQQDIRIQPNDLLAIQVYSRTLNQVQAGIFNIPSDANSANDGYRVNANGDIIIPVIGLVKAVGLTKYELEQTLSEKLENNVKDPLVIVRFLHFNVNVLGEVKAPGIQTFSIDRITIIDALSAAGDLTDFARRDNIIVIREEAGQKRQYQLDLRDNQIFESPVYALRPNDIVYVSPTRQKLKSLAVSTDSQRKAGFVITILSFVVSIATLVVYTLR